MRIGVVQILNAPPDMAASLRAALIRLDEAKKAGADLVVFPELFLGGYFLDQEMVRRASAARAALARIQAAVDELEIACVTGLPDLRDGILYNAIAILRPHKDPARYVKTHLYGGEPELFTPGSEFWTGDIAGWPCGVLVCYELGFPEIARSLAVAGARLLIAPSAFGRERTRIWQIVTISRALENGCFLAAAAHAGKSGDLVFAGHSRVVDPAGQLLADAGDRADMLVVDIKERVVDEVRAGRPDGHAYLRDRRPELYGAVTKPLAEPDERTD